MTERRSSWGSAQRWRVSRNGEVTFGIVRRFRRRWRRNGARGRIGEGPLWAAAHVGGIWRSCGAAAHFFTLARAPTIPPALLAEPPPNPTHSLLAEPPPTPNNLPFPHAGGVHGLVACGGMVIRAQAGGLRGMTALPTTVNRKPQIASRPTPPPADSARSLRSLRNGAHRRKKKDNGRRREQIPNMHSPPAAAHFFTLAARPPFRQLCWRNPHHNPHTLCWRNPHLNPTHSPLAEPPTHLRIPLAHCVRGGMVVAH